jgi:hypothetical protein
MKAVKFIMKAQPIARMFFMIRHRSDGSKFGLGIFTNCRGISVLSTAMAQSRAIYARRKFSRRMYVPIFGARKRSVLRDVRFPVDKLLQIVARLPENKNKEIHKKRRVTVVLHSM